MMQPSVDVPDMAEFCEYPEGCGSDVVCNTCSRLSALIADRVASALEAAAAPMRRNAVTWRQETDAPDASRVIMHERARTYDRCAEICERHAAQHRSTP